MTDDFTPFECSKTCVCPAGHCLVTGTVTLAEFLSQLWQPIETAPKDGTIILTFSPAHTVASIAQWAETYTREYCWHSYRGVPFAETPGQQPTHWMPLPEPPTNRRESKDND